MNRCPKCDAELMSDARFCGVCGHRIAAKAGGKRKDIVKAPPGAPTLAPPNRAADLIAGEPPPAVRPQGKKAGMPKSAPASAPEPLPSYLTGEDPYLGALLGGRFEVIDKLGEGGFGAVYRGRQSGTGREVALKLLHPEMTRDDNVLARFRREGEVLCQLRDAHTITTYDFDQTDDGSLFIAMELLSGRSLHDVFQDEAPIHWQRMLGIVVQMCSSLQEAHSLGIVHRDLKPENIHLEQRFGNPEYVKILDFGIAKVMRGDGVGKEGQQIQQLTATGQTLGTLEYMSPEQLMGKELDGRSDIYAVGVLCYEMMTGRLPFPDAIGPAAQIAAQLKKTPQRPSEVRPEMEIPAEVDEIVLKCLGKRPPDRYDDMEQLRGIGVDLLERHEHGQAVTPGTPTAPPRAQEPPHPEAEAPLNVVPAHSEAVQPAEPWSPPDTPASSSNLLYVIIAIAVALAAGVGAFFALQ